MTEHEPIHVTPSGGHEVLENRPLSADVHRLVIRASRIAEVCRPGQFVIVRLGDGAERIPLTIAESDAANGTITLVIQAVGKSTGDLVAVPANGCIHDVTGPLGRPSDLIGSGMVVCVAGGVGAAVVYPIAHGMAELGTDVITILGARSENLLVYADEFAALGETIVCTDDGSAGRAGFVTDALEDLLAHRRVDAVYAAGPVPMMRAVATVTGRTGVRTIVSLNPIMVDGTGMCGGCRVTVGGAMHFACVDGPEFDAAEVDFDELADRLSTYRSFEREATAHVCRSAG
jgi:ferredoxin--NADP+ reductase